MRMTFPQQPTQTNMQAWVRAGLLLAMGVYLGFLMLTGTINNYMNVQFQWLVGVAAVLFLFIGLWNLWGLWRNVPEDHTLNDNLEISHEGHNHTKLTWTAIAIVTIPLAFALLIPSRPLGASSITSISLNPVGVGDAASAARSNADRNILDWLREFNRVDNPATFNGEDAILVGFVYREPYMSDNQFMLARYTLSCCVADAFAIGIPIQSENASQYDQGEWVQIVGTFESGQFGEENLPILRPISIELTQQPASPYLYP